MASLHCLMRLSKRSATVGWLGALLAMLAASAPAAYAAEPARSPVRRVAILVGMENYTRVRPLGCTSNDVSQLEHTLVDKGDYQVWTIIDAERKLLEAKLEKLLAEVGRADILLVYFTGHGFRDAEGNLYLAAVDCDVRNPAPGGLPVAWLRQRLGSCPARFKLLVLDTCHAGSEKGDEAQGVSAKELGEPFRGLTDVITLASSQEDEKSLMWDTKRQSLFSYWLNQALKGHADKDDIPGVSVDELYEYVVDRVPYVAQELFHRPQNPVRIIGPKSVGVPVVIQPKPCSLKALLKDMAEQLAADIELRRVSAVGVPEFTVEDGLTLGKDFGVLGAYCAAELEGYLLEESRTRFQVIEGRSLDEALRAKGLGPADLRTNKVKDLRAADRKVATVVLGVLRSRRGRVITLQTRLLGTDRLDLLGRAGGTALLNENEYAMIGRSAVLRPEDYRPPAPRPGVTVRPVAATLIERMDEQSGHPGQDKDFPGRVAVVVNGQSREPYYRGNDCFVTLSKGGQYEIWIENHATRPIFLRLLVDGLNTLPEPVRHKAVQVEPKKEDEPAQYLPAQRVNFSEARAWYLDPATRNEDGAIEPQTYAVRGFFLDTDSGQYRAFRIVDAQESVAARRGYTAQLGLITAAFYEAVDPKLAQQRSRTRSLTDPLSGTGFGGLYDEQLETYTGKLVPGRLIGVWDIRYVDPATLERLKQGQTTSR